MVLEPLWTTSLMVAAVLALLAAGCATPAMVTPAKIPLVASNEDAAAMAGRQVDVTGTARNAKLAPAVEVNDFLVYCLGLDEWPADAMNQTVTVRGTLEHSDQFQAPDKYSTGTQGAVWVLRGCQRVP